MKDIGAGLVSAILSFYLSTLAAMMVIRTAASHYCSWANPSSVWCGLGPDSILDFAAGGSAFWVGILAGGSRLYFIKRPWKKHLQFAAVIGAILLFFLLVRVSSSFYLSVVL